MAQSKSRRTDPVKAAVVDKGIQLQERVGSDLAVKFMKTNNVPVEVAIRVLHRPKKRRNYL